MELRHGGDTVSYQEQYGREPLDFSANTSPLGMPESARRAVISWLEESPAAYPDPECRELRKALSVHLGVPDEWILCGNGASDLIWRIAGTVQPGGDVLIPVPSFREYEAAVNRAGGRMVPYTMIETDGFSLREDFTDRITSRTKMIFLCEPGNPSGRTTPKALLHEIIRKCRQTGTVLVADECFLDFLHNPDEHTLIREITECRMVILKAFTKFYGMAGLRLGYAVCADEQILKAAAEAGPPWSVSGAAQAAGTAVLRDPAYPEAVREMVSVQRNILMEGLRGKGCRVIPGEANYLLFYYPDERLAEKMADQGILIRDCRDFRGLGPCWYRTAVRSPRENAVLLSAISSI